MSGVFWSERSSLASPIKDGHNQGIKDAIEGGHKQRIMSSIKEIDTEMLISLLFLKFRPRQILN